MNVSKSFRVNRGIKTLNEKKCVWCVDKCVFSVIVGVTNLNLNEDSRADQSLFLLLLLHRFHGQFLGFECHFLHFSLLFVHDLIFYA